jgi:hypothetical protein
MALFRKKMFSAALAGTDRSAESSSFCIARGQRNGIQNRGRTTIPAAVLELAELERASEEDWRVRIPKVNQLADQVDSYQVNLPGLSARHHGQSRAYGSDGGACAG